MSKFRNVDSLSLPQVLGHRTLVRGRSGFTVHERVQCFHARLHENFVLDLEHVVTRQGERAFKTFLVF